MLPGRVVRCSGSSICSRDSQWVTWRSNSLRSSKFRNRYGVASIYRTGIFRVRMVPLRRRDLPNQLCKIVPLFIAAESTVFRGDKPARVAANMANNPLQSLASRRGFEPLLPP
jgi:hypothetical protein